MDTIMRWLSDWLYQLVFAEVAGVWKQAQELAMTREKTPLAHIFVAEKSAFSQEPFLVCTGDTLRAWKFTGQEIIRIATSEIATPKPYTRNMFFTTGQKVCAIGEAGKR